MNASDLFNSIECYDLYTFDVEESLRIGNRIHYLYANLTIYAIVGNYHLKIRCALNRIRTMLQSANKQNTIKRETVC